LQAVQLVIPSGMMVSVCKASDADRMWRPHKMMKTVTANVVGGSSGAIVAEYGGFLILTRHEKIADYMNKE